MKTIEEYFLRVLTILRVMDERNRDIFIQQEIEYVENLIEIKKQRDGDGD